MKKIIVFFIIIGCALMFKGTASAQVAARADVGTLCYYSVTPANGQVGMMFGFGTQVGADYDIHVKGTFYVTPGLYWSYRATTDYMISRPNSEFLQEHFLNVPLYAKWKLNIKPDRFGLYIYCGPVFSVGLASRSRVSWHISDVDACGTYDYYNKVADIRILNYGYDSLKDYLMNEIESAGLGFRRFDIRLDFGVGFVLKRNHELALGFDLGTFNRYVSNLPEKTYLNSCHSYIGYRYRFGKKQQ